MYDYFMGQSLPSINNMIKYVENLGFKNFEEFLSERKSEVETRARISLYKSRLARIRQLTEVKF